MKLTYTQIIKELAKKIYRPIYFLMGDEPYYIDEVTNFVMENVLTESEKSFNQTVVYGKDCDVRQLNSIARKFPMMANHQVVVLKEAQDMKQIEDLVYYAQKPLKSTILVINYKYKKLASNKKLYHAIDATGCFMESKKLYDYQVPKWINAYVTEKKYAISPEAEMLLTEYLGTDLKKISNEINKLIISLPQGTKFTPELIEKNIGISKDFNNFELQNALGKKEVLKANRIADYFSKNPNDNPLIVTLATMFNFFSKILVYHFISDKSPQNVAASLKLNPYFVNEYIAASKRYPAAKVVNIISYIRDADAKIKGVGNVSLSQGDILKELIYKILH